MKWRISGNDEIFKSHLWQIQTHWCCILITVCFILCFCYVLWSVNYYFGGLIAYSVFANLLCYSQTVSFWFAGLSFLVLPSDNLEWNHQPSVDARVGHVSLQLPCCRVSAFPEAPYLFTLTYPVWKLPELFWLCADVHYLPSFCAQAGREPLTLIFLFDWVLCSCDSATWFITFLLSLLTVTSRCANTWASNIRMFCCNYILQNILEHQIYAVLFGMSSAASPQTHRCCPLDARWGYVSPKFIWPLEWCWKKWKVIFLKAPHRVQSHYRACQIQLGAEFAAQERGQVKQDGEGRGPDRTWISW